MKNFRRCMTTARTTYERMQKLYEVGGISKQGPSTTRKPSSRVYSSKRGRAEQDADGAGPDQRYDHHHERESPPTMSRLSSLLFTISDLSWMKARIWVNDNEMRLLHNGVKATATLGGYYDHRNRPPACPPEKRIPCVRRTPSISNSKNHGTIKGTGMTAEIKVETYANPKAIVVERKSVPQRREGGTLRIYRKGRAWHRKRA